MEESERKGWQRQVVGHQGAYSTKKYQKVSMAKGRFQVLVNELLG